MLPPITESPACFAIGIDSPVSRLSSTLVLPFTMYPSVGIISPTVTLNKSPSIRFSISDSIFSPLRVINIFFGILLFKLLVDRTASSITFSSIVFPIRINEIINAPVSKNILLSPLKVFPLPNSSLGKTEMINELKLPIEIKVSILKSKNFIFLKADI